MPVRTIFPLLLLFALAATLLLVGVGPGWTFAANVALTVFALLVIIVPRTPSLYLGLWKLRFRLLNTPATWDLSVQFGEPSAGTAVEELAIELVRWGREGSTLVSSARNRAVVKLRSRFVVEISTQSADLEIPGVESRADIHVGILPVTVGYRDSERFLNEQLLPVLGWVRDQMRPSWMSYALRVEFPEKNPYFGLYLQRFRLGVVRDFRVELETAAAAGRGRVTVGTHCITITSSTVEDFRNAASAALALRTPER